MAKKYQCPTHKTWLTSWCADCTTDLENAPDPTTMTPDERVAEFERWCGPLTVSFGKLHERIEALAGGPVWTHELSSANHENMIQTIREQSRKDMA